MLCQKSQHCTPKSNIVLSTISFFEQGKGKNQTRSHRHHHRDNIAMYNVYIVSYVKGTLFINSVSILSLVAAIIFSQLGIQWPKMDPFGNLNFFKYPGEGSPDFAIQVGINGCYTVIFVPPSCSNVVPPFYNLTKAPICVVIKTAK